MRKRIVLGLVMVLVAIATSACQYVLVKRDTLPSHVVYSEKLKERIVEEKVPLVLLVVKDGQAGTYDQDGNGPVKLTQYENDVLYECVAPGEQNGLVCKGLSGHEPIQSIETITIIQSGTNTCITRIGAGGQKYEICW